MKIKLVIDDVPPSLNRLSHAHWRKWWSHKRKWQTLFEGYLMAANTTRPLPGSVSVTGSLRFPVKRRRDEGNYRALLEKALGDALVNGGWLKDDTPEQFTFGELSFERDTGPRKTSIILDIEE